MSTVDFTIRKIVPQHTCIYG